MAQCSNCQGKGFLTIVTDDGVLTPDCDQCDGGQTPDLNPNPDN